MTFIQLLVMNFEAAQEILFESYIAILFMTYAIHNNNRNPRPALIIFLLYVPDHSRICILYHISGPSIFIRVLISAIFPDTNDHYDLFVSANGPPDQKNGIFWAKYCRSWGKHSSTIQTGHTQNAR